MLQQLTANLSTATTAEEFQCTAHNHVQAAGNAPTYKLQVTTITKICIKFGVFLLD